MMAISAVLLGVSTLLLGTIRHRVFELLAHDLLWAGGGAAKAALLLTPRQREAPWEAAGLLLATALCVSTRLVSVMASLNHGREPQRDKDRYRDGFRDTNGDGDGDGDGDRGRGKGRDRQRVETGNNTNLVVCTYQYTNQYMCRCIRMYTYMCICIHTNIRIHVYIYKYIYIYK